MHDMIKEGQQALIEYVELKERHMAELTALNEKYKDLDIYDTFKFLKIDRELETVRESDTAKNIAHACIDYIRTIPFSVSRISEEIRSVRYFLSK